MDQTLGQILSYLFTIQSQLDAAKQRIGELESTACRQAQPQGDDVSQIERPAEQGQ